MVNQDIVAERLRKFLVKQFPAMKNVGNEEPLLNNGLIDSLGVLDVVAFIEKEFGISVSDEDLLPENFGSVRSLSNFVGQKTNSTT
jgi:acyl carrier protein